jgi:predicted transposase YbfD/YdcC
MASPRTTRLIGCSADGFKGLAHDCFEQSGGGHGRVEKRQVWVSKTIVKWLGEELLNQWPGLASVAVVESTRQDLGDPSGKVSVERRYFISSHESIDARLFAQAIRQHWGIENQLHWRLDVSMNEDQCRLRVKHGAENFSRLRRIAMNKLKRWEMKKANGKVKKLSLRLKQKACGWSHKFLIEALLA